MKFGIFYELQLPKPWGPDDERQLVQDALAQVELADRIGIDYAWAVEHHFLEEYSHCSASEVFLAAAAARTKRIRLGHGIRQVIANYNHPARTAEAVAMLDLVSNGRAELGIGEGATRLELGGFDIPAKEKRAMALEAAEQIANMMVMQPYPGFEGRSFKMPCRNVLPKPVQKPHPPMWMACTNRDTIKVAASNGLGALAFSFIDEAEARTWSKTYYDIIKSDACVPLGHSVNANIAMVSAFSLHADREEAARRGQEGFEFFRFAISALVTNDCLPGHSKLFEQFQTARDDAMLDANPASRREPASAFQGSRGIGTTDDFRAHARTFEAAGVDQIILLQQAGRNRHEHICESLDLLAARRAAANSPPPRPNASGARPRSWRPTSRRRWPASSAWRRWLKPTSQSCGRLWQSLSSTSRRLLDRNASPWVPLAGIRVVDLTSMLSGPWATMILADQGADVIKVEEPGKGDHTRSLSNRHKGFSAQFLNLNRNKRSVTIDLKTSEGARPAEAARRHRRRVRAELPSRRGRAPRHRRGRHPRGGAAHRLRVDQRLRRERPLRQEADLRPDHPGPVRPHQRAGRLRHGAAAPHPHRAARQAHRRHGRAGDHRGAGRARCSTGNGPARAPLHARCRARLPVGLRHGPADLRRPAGRRAAPRPASST